MQNADIYLKKWLTINIIISVLGLSLKDILFLFSIILRNNTIKFIKIADSRVALRTVINLLETLSTFNGV